jgi:hypothetical protein
MEHFIKMLPRFEYRKRRNYKTIWNEAYFRALGNLVRREKILINIQYF